MLHSKDELTLGFAILRCNVDHHGLHGASRPGARHERPDRLDFPSICFEHGVECRDGRVLDEGVEASSLRSSQEVVGKVPARLEAGILVGAVVGLEAVHAHGNNLRR